MNTEANSSKSFVDLINEMDAPGRQQRDRGTMFELLSRTYFQNEPLYERLFEEVWTLNEVPEQYGIPKKDTGVDLVAKERETGALVAIQCKYHAVDNAIQKSNIDSFLNEVGKAYYSWGIIVTSTDKWSKNANDALEGRDKKITRISLSQLQDSQIDWSSFSYTSPEKVRKQQKKTPRDHQKPAIKAVLDGFKSTDRGKLIMAPGTGKTYTSMAIAEEMAKEKDGVFKVLYLVPSIQLLSQTLRGWTADTNFNMDAIAVCSDRKVTKKMGDNEFEDIAASDIGYPATTSHNKLLEYKELIESNKLKGDFLTVFSTYQSIDVIVEAQNKGFYEFDLIVCDEAHRTTGITEDGSEDSSFTKVHDNDKVRAHKRLYQTATPRVYGEKAKEKATDISAIISDMSNEGQYGPEFYRIGFGEAVRKGILTDYKVMVLAVDEEMIARNFQQMLSKDSELNFDDVTKIIGCWNGLVRRRSHSDEVLGPPMKRAIAFAGTIKESKLITDMFSYVVDQYLYQDSDDSGTRYQIEVEHADGSMNALEKNKKISWLKDEVPENTCRILSNARFLTEGVDVPDLDAIMFLKPRKSKIDIAQAVGRVMRKSPGKDYGYVILPIGVPAGTNENSVLDNNEKYRVVWEVLNALRSLDERFDATINKLDLNKNRSEHIQVIGVGEAPEDGELKPMKDSHQLSMELDAEELSDLEKAIYGKIVRKVGNVRYWESWSEDVSKIASQHMLRIKVMLEDNESPEYKEFNKFLIGLRHNINDSITEQQAIEMLAQHLITKPVFEALFDSYSFVNDNPVSRSMDTILKVLDENQLEKEQESLEAFYESVRIRAQGVDNLKGKQEIIVQLYDKFFKIGFKDTTEKLGIVFTPVEIVDFIIRSVDQVMKKHFDKSLSDQGVHILDPFTGTGTFIVRLLQSGLISTEDLVRKYTQELHANEIVLLSYYIAAINVEETFHSISEGDYKPFEGIVLTDTFESTENTNSFENELFGENNKRLSKQRQESIFAIIGNPPYSMGQSSANSDNANVSYPSLEKAITQTYAKHSKANAKNTLFDSYIKAFRWSTDRLKDKGIVAFVTNGSFIDSRGADGLRKSLFEEFNHIYILNLRGDQRTVGEKSRQEGGKVFGSGSRTPVAITFLVKDASDTHKLYYKDIGDYLTREEKLSILENTKNLSEIDWTEIVPDKNNDWINQRDLSYDSYPKLDGDIFNSRGIGVGTKRDPWVYGFSKNKVIENANRLATNFNFEIDRLNGNESGLNKSETYIKWSARLLTRFKSRRKIELDDAKIKVSMYRPFTKKYLYYQDEIVDRPGPFRFMFGEENKIIYVTKGAKVGMFACNIVDAIPTEVMLGSSGTGFPINDASQDTGLFEEKDEYNNISENYANKLGISKLETLHYVYGILHSSDYREKYASDLSKDLPHIPIVENLTPFIKAGKELIDLHLNYEILPALPELKIIYNKTHPSYKVDKIRYAKRGELDRIIFNKDITITNIPSVAYEYLINGRSAIDWIIDQYRIKEDPKSKLIDDPNDFSDDDQYIFKLLLSIITLSVKTMEITSMLPPLESPQN